MSRDSTEAALCLCLARPAPQGHRRGLCVLYKSGNWANGAGPSDTWSSGAGPSDTWARRAGPGLQEPEGVPLLPARRKPPLRRHTRIINVQDAPLTHGFTMHPRQNLRLAQHPQALAPLVPTLHSEKGQYSGKQPRCPVRMTGAGRGAVVGECSFYWRTIWRNDVVLLFSH